MGNCAECDDDFQLRHGAQLIPEMGVAQANLCGAGFVGRRQAAHGISDAAIAQLHIGIGKIVDAQRFGGSGETEAVERRIEQFSRNVTGKGTPGAIGPLLSRPETENQQFRVERAEGRHGTRMPIRVSLANAGQMLGQARTGDAVGRIMKCRHGGDVSMSPMQLNWDIFCRVIDNYGDIGICWRLARQLVREHHKRVRLWIDDLHSLRPLCPEVDLGLATQCCHGVEIVHWTEPVAVDRVGDVIIEAFACELPAPWIAGMAAATQKPCWINLEYLTAESWADGCHAMASPHPTLPLVKHFFFPGFSSATGGLLREHNLLAMRDAEAGRCVASDALEVSLFCYESAPVAELLDILMDSPMPVRLHVAPGQPAAAVANKLGRTGPWQGGNLKLLPFEFLPQDEYDRLLWRCDVNFVRGEDSFVRAQWAARPFVWQPYQQAAGAHLEKLDAFLARYVAGMSANCATVAVDLFQAWNSRGDLRQAWHDFLAVRPEIASYNRRWAENLAGNPDLTDALVKFCSSKV